MNSRSTEDTALTDILDWALGRMSAAGYPVRSNVSLLADPNLSIMGYAKKEGDSQCIVVAGWALDSEMLGGLVLHELAHVYHTERGAPSHDHDLLEDVISEIAERDGLTEREKECLLDSFSHLQNIIVDDIVFETMTKKELALVKTFFSGWISQRSTGDPVADASLLSRNAFAVASLKRRDLFEPDGEMGARNKSLISEMGPHARKAFDELERLLENARGNTTKEQFREFLSTYLEEILYVIRERDDLRDLR